jgi:maltoporin
MERQFAREQYQRDTETRERALLTESRRPLAERMEQVLQDFVDLNGYFRAGYGRSDQGGPQVPFQAPGALAKYRLGNETENYGELSFGKNFYVPGLFSLEPKLRAGDTPAGPIARIQLTLAFVDGYANYGSMDAFKVGLPEAWASIGNVWAAQPAMKFWAGNRYYRRHDIHINDFFFYNMSGGGGGVEDLQLPFGKLALAWIGNGAQSGVVSDVSLPPDPKNQAGFSKGNLDLRLYDVALPLGQGEFGFDYAYAGSGQDANGIQAPSSDGVAFNFVHTRDRLLSEGGFNKLSLQVGSGAAKTFTSGFDRIGIGNDVYIAPDAPGSWRFRVTEQLVLQLWEHFSVGPAFVYQFTDFRDGRGQQQWLSSGLRPVVHFNKYVSLAFEGGVDYVDDSASGSRDYLYKLTLAPQVSLGRYFMSRPVLRAYVTYAGWGDGFRGQVGGTDYRDRTDGWAWGVQMETWW